jgi:hypothetical protein
VSIQFCLEKIMFKKAFAVVVLATIAIFAGPAAANAAGYVASDHVTVSGSSTPGGTAVVNFLAGSFGAGDSIKFAVTGEGTVTLSAVRAAVQTTTLTKTADTSGAVSLNVKLPTSATGSYTVTATDVSTGTVGTATITVAAADGGAARPGAGLPFTGANISPLIIWGAGGILLLGIALLVVRGIVRRQRISA